MFSSGNSFKFPRTSPEPMDSNVLDSLFDSTSSVSSTTSSSNVKESFQKRLLKRKRKPSQLPILDPDTVSLRSLEEFVGNVRKTNKRLSLPRLSSVSELLSPMRDRVLNIMCTQKSTMITQQQQDIKLRMSKKLSSPTSTTKKFRYSTWLETCDESLRQTMSEHEVERQNVIYELLSEEEKMVENLDLAQRVYRNGMKTLNILSDDELKQIFGPLEDILPLHEDLLYRLKPKYSTCVDAVGNIYLEWLQRIRSSYVSYCSNLINAKELLDQKRQNVRVEDYLKRCIDSGFSRKLDLWDFLDQPRSRLMKYPIVFRRIQKRTKDSHEDKRILLDTINFVEELIDDVSQATSATLCTNVIQRLIYTSDEQKNPIINKQTKLLCQGELKNTRGQKLHVFLFEEILLFTRIATRNDVKCYQLTNHPIPIELLLIEDLEDGCKIPELNTGSFSRTLGGTKQARNVFRCSTIENHSIEGRIPSITLQARDVYDKQQWIQTFKNVKNIVEITKNSILK